MMFYMPKQGTDPATPVGAFTKPSTPSRKAIAGIFAMETRFKSGKTIGFPSKMVIRLSLLKLTTALP
jgi:hypothetical protein